MYLTNSSRAPTRQNTAQYTLSPNSSCQPQERGNRDHKEPEKTCLNLFFFSGTDDIVCVIGMVDVKILGPVQNGERVYASLEHPGVAVPESRVNQSVLKDAFLLGQSVQRVDESAGSLITARCFVSVLLSISSGHVTQAVTGLRADVKQDVKSEVKQVKKRCLRGTGLA